MKLNDFIFNNAFLIFDSEIPCDIHQAIEIQLATHSDLCLKSNGYSDANLMDMVHDHIKRDIFTHIQQKLLGGTINYHFKVQPYFHKYVYAHREMYEHLIINHGLYGDYLGLSFMDEYSYRLPSDAYVHKIGTICDMSAYIDANISYNDKLSFSLNDVYFNIQFDEPIVSETIITYNYRFGLVQEEGIVDFFIDDESSIRFNDYKIYKRNNAIIELLK
jgi:hypothetical protein